MKNIFVIARLNLLISLRKGTLYALMLAIAGVSTLTFYLARSDGKLFNEIEIRLSYSYGVTYSLLTLMIIAFACFSIRNQLDAKNIHLLTSFPLDSKSIFFGQALALIIIIILSEIVLLCSVVFNVWFYSRNYPLAEQEAVFQKYFETNREVFPEYKSKREIAMKYLEGEGIDIKKLDYVQWYDLYTKALYKETLIRPKESKIWQINLQEVPAGNGVAYLNYNFQRAKKREMVKGYFEITSPGYNIYFKKEVEVHHYAENKLALPLDLIPENGQFEVKFTNTGENSTVVNRSGLSFSYSKGNLTDTISKCFLSQVLHLTVSALVGLCAGIGLTFSVATFMVITLYIISSGQPLFQVMLNDSDYLIIQSGGDFVHQILQVSVWFTKGLQAPDLVSSVSAGLNLDGGELLVNWLPALLVYGFLATLIGCVMLKNKELDKVQV